MSDPTISGFMIVRNVESQGYPYLEAARAALGVCDELLISDGGSTDRTWDGLRALRSCHPDRIRLFRDTWPGTVNRGEVIAEVSNVVRRRCDGDWCLSVQANEVFHEASVSIVRLLPRERPDVEVFSFRYLGMMGPNLMWTATERRRMFRNIPDIVAVGDATEISHVLPRECPTELCRLPEPVYRYRTLFPVNYVVRLQVSSPRPYWMLRELELAQHALAATEHEPDRVGAFWTRVQHFLEHDLWRDVPAGTPMPVPRRLLGSTDRAPATVAHLLGRWSYELDDSLAALERSFS